jgi:hypothetical protein
MSKEERLSTNTQQSAPPQAQFEYTQKLLYDNLLSNLGLIALFGIAIAYRQWIEPWIERRKLSLSYSREQEKKIDLLLEGIRLMSNADRVLLAETTNGKYTLSGRSLKDLVLTHQVTAGSIKRAPDGGLLMQDQTCIRSLFESLSQSPFLKRKTAEIQNDYYRLYLEALDVHYVIYCFLEVEDIPLGFIAIHYCSENKWMDWDGAAAYEIKSFAAAITSTVYGGRQLLKKINQLIGKKN